MINPAELATSLQSSLSYHLQSHKSSIRAIARYSKCSKYFIEKTIKGSTKKLDLAEALNLADYLFTRGSLIDCPEPIIRMMEHVHEVKNSIDQRKKRPIPEEIVSDFTSYIILSLSSDGIKISTIQQIFGEELANEKIAMLIKNQLLQKKDECVTSVAFIASLDNVRKHCSHIISMFDLSNIGKEKCYIHLTTQNVSEDFLRELYHKQKELHRWIAEECSKESNRGDIPIFALGAVNTVIARMEPIQ